MKLKNYLLLVFLCYIFQVNVYAQKDFLKLESEILKCDNCTMSEIYIASLNVCKRKDSIINLLEIKIYRNLEKATSKSDKDIYKKVINNALIDIKTLRRKSLQNHRNLEGNESNLEYSCNLLYIYWSNRIIDLLQYYQDYVDELPKD